MVNVRNEFINHFGQSKQYGRLTQSYVQKAFTIFNLWISSKCVDKHDESIGSKLQPIMVSNTQNELIETQLNIEYLLLSQSISHKTVTINDFSRYEIGLIRSLDQNENNCKNVMKLLPSIQDLYYIIDHSLEFYPFGMIKAYQILSMQIALSDKSQTSFPAIEIKKLTINELEQLFQAGANQSNDVDEVAESMWKYVIAQLNRCEINSSSITIAQMANMIEHIKNITCCYRSSDLRQTATEGLATIVSYFKNVQDSTLLIEFAALLLSLLRDDDSHVRNRISEVVMSLIRENQDGNSFEKGTFLLEKKD